MSLWRQALSMWIPHRLKRIKSKLSHLKVYLQTLSDANEIERQTNWAECKNPVLLLYGFGATRRSVSILESRLRKDGFDVFSLRLGGFLDLFNTSPIDETAKKVAQKIENLSGRYHLPRFSIIGYSKGGLIGRYYVSLLGGDRRVHTLITLATPHQGNPWILFRSFLLGGLLSKGLRQMMPASRFMRKLSKTPIPSNMYVVSIFSPGDRVSPPKYCKLAERNNGCPVLNVSLPFLHHSDFVIKQSAYQEILKHLKEGLHFASNV